MSTDYGNMAEKQNFVTKKFKKLQRNKEYGFKNAKEYIEENQKHKCLYDKVQKLRA